MLPTFDITGPGRNVVDYWREMLAKDDTYGPSSDHGNGLAVIAYIDALRTVCDQSNNYSKGLTDTIQFNRDEVDRLRHELNVANNKVRALELTIAAHTEA